MNLPKGITGFRSLNDQELPLMDTIQFKQLSHIFVRELGGEFEGFGDHLLQRNYYTVEYVLRGEYYFVLLNCHYPYLAFTSTLGGIIFTDVPLLTAKYKPYYSVLKKDYLDTPLSTEHLSELTKAELEQISYWKPRTVGEVIFNNWD